MRFEYLPIAVSLVVAGLIPLVLLAAGALLRPHHPSAVKSEAFECGNPSSGSAWGRFSVKFYLPAILFVVFDIEVVFLYPWAVLFRRLGVAGFVEGVVFIGILTLGLVYVWRKGALEWA